jgi:diguanylate cyclase (GGDEF)-like protein/PAS domain S-box-containing protein
MRTEFWQQRRNTEKCVLGGIGNPGLPADAQVLPDMPPPSGPGPSLQALRLLRRSVLAIPIAYALTGYAWILWSDEVVHGLSKDPDTLNWMQSWKGLFYVTATSVALFLILRKATRALATRDQQLAERERQYHDLFSCSPEPMLVFDRESLAVLDVNDAAVIKYGWPRNEFIGMSIAALRPEAEVPRLKEFLAGERGTLEEAGLWRHRLRDGREVDVEVRSHSIQFNGRSARFVLLHDVTDRLRAQKRETRLTALYATALRCAQSIVRLEEREPTFVELCRTVVESGGLLGAEVLLWDKDGPGTRRIAFAGNVPPEELAVSIERTCVTDARRGRSTVCRDLAAVSPALAADGRRSVAVVPLREAGQPVGALSVYAEDPSWFDEELVALIEELAIDFSFTLDRLRLQAARTAVEAALVDSEERFRHLLHSVTDIAWSATLAGDRLLYANAAVETVYGRPLHDFYDDPALWLKCTHPDDIERVKLEDRRMRELGRAEYEYRIVRPDGEVRWVLARTALLLDANGAPARVGGLLSDITARKQSEQQLELAAAVFRESREAILLADHRANVLAVNPAFSAITGYTDAEVRGRNPRFLQSGRQSPEFYRQMWREISERGHWQGEIWNRGKFGDVYPQWMSVTAVRDRGGRPTHYIAIASDLTERKRAEARIERLARFDSLTGLANRSLLRLRAEAGLAERKGPGQGFALLHIGLDEFSTINDSLGHGLGDVVLVQLAMRMQRAAPAGAVIARIDGDEFALWVPCDDSACSRDIADQMRTAMRQPLELEGRKLTVTASVGVACCPRDATDFDSLMRFASAALSHAKTAGRDGCESFQPTINADACERLDLESGLRQALDRREFELHYQPQIELETGQVVGFEALLRWNRGAAGTVPPSKFIPVAERSGLIGPIGAWVLDEACRQARAWRDAGLQPVRIAVNLSAPQLADDSLVGLVRQTLEKHSLPAEALELEVTESMLIAEADVVARRLAALADLGVELALDDFGTGYSNLSYLKSFPLSRLKLDRSFVVHVLDDARDQSIARAVIAVGRALDLDVIAEGIESPAQAFYLKQMGCDLGQGYLYARPMPARDIPGWFRTHSTRSLVVDPTEAERLPNGAVESLPEVPQRRVS